MSNFFISMFVKIVKGLGESGLREYAVEFVAWLREKSAETDNPIDDGVVELVAAFLGVE